MTRIWLLPGSLVRVALSVGLGGALATLATESRAQTQVCPTGSMVSGVDLEVTGASPDWTTAKADGTSFAIIKATQGTSYTSSGFAASWAAMKSEGMTRGAYHFFDPTVSGTDQANYFLGVMGTLEAGDLPPTLDIECPTSNNEPDSDDCLGNGTSGDATGAQITQYMNEWISTVKAATGVNPMVYSFGSYFSGDGVTTTGLEDYPLWLADYSGNSCFNVYSPWTTATIWQYAGCASVSGIPYSVDNDYFLGTLAQLTAFTMSGTTPPQDAGTVDSGSDSGGDVVPDAGGSACTLPNGDQGECLNTSVCDMLGGTYMPTAGYCPGPTDIQCCTGMPAATSHDAGGTSGDDATVVGGSGSGSSPSSGSGGGTSPGITIDGGTSTGHGPGSPDAAASKDGSSDDQPEVAPSSGGCNTSGTRRTTDAWLVMAALGLVVATRRRRSRS
jgi:lysozyme